MVVIHPQSISLEGFIQNPPARTEWVDGRFLEKPQMTAKTGRIQARLAFYWRSYMLSSNQGG